jgi:hypothetical protein
MIRQTSASLIAALKRRDELTAPMLLASIVRLASW